MRDTFEHSVLCVTPPIVTWWWEGALQRACRVPSACLSYGVTVVWITVHKSSSEWQAWRNLGAAGTFTRLFQISVRIAMGVP